MKKSLHPGVAIAIVLVVVGVAVFYIMKGMEPQREPNAMSKEEINKQMMDFNKRMSGGKGAGQGGGSSAPGQ